MKRILALSASVCVVSALWAETPIGKETWTYLGEGKLRDDLVTNYWFVDNYEFPVDIFASDQVEGRYKLVDAYKNYPMKSTAALIDHEHSFVVDAEDPDHVWIEMGCIGLNYNEYETDYFEFVIWSKADNEYNNVYGDWDAILEYEGRIWGTLVDGCITFPPGTLLTHYYQPPANMDPNGTWTLPVDGFIPANRNGKFRILLPGAPDYGITLSQFDPEINGEDITLRFGVEGSSDIASIRYMVLPAEDAENVLETLAAGGGTKVAFAPDMSGCMTLSVPYTSDGQFTLAVVPFNSQDEAKPGQTLDFTCAYDESEWKKCGMATYTEGILCSSDFSKFYEQQGEIIFRPQTYEVSIEANKLRPGLIRLVDPYGEPYQWATSQSYDHSRNYYMEIDCQDFDRVSLLKTVDGIGLEIGLSTIYVGSRADRERNEKGTSIAEIDQMGIWGKFDETTGEITFPIDALLNWYHLAPMNIYWANKDGKFKVVVPQEAIDIMTDRSGVETIATPTDQPERWYTVQGVEVTSSNRQPGIYIVRRGSETKKIKI